MQSPGTGWALVFCFWNVFESIGWGGGGGGAILQVAGMQPLIGYSGCPKPYNS